MKDHKVLVFVLLALACTVAVLFGMNYLEAYPFEGSEVRFHDAYQLDFVRMNKTDEHIMPVRAGDELVVSFDIAQGNVDLTISLGDVRLYRGDRIDTGSFTLPVDTDGDCRIEVRGSGARGRLSVLVRPGE